MRERLGLLLFSVCATLLSILLLFALGERFFFDRMFYKKSALHGYGDKIWSFPQEDYWADWVRARDVITLFSLPLPEKNKLFFPAHADEELHIAVIGDSMASGVGVLPAENYPKQLQQYLQTHNNDRWKRIHVYNFSRAGDHIVDHWFKYQEIKRKKLPIDLYIFDVVDNDLIFDYEGKYASKERYLDFKEDCNEKKEVMATPNKGVDDPKLANSFAPDSANTCVAKNVWRSLDSSDPIVFLSWSSFLRSEEIPFAVPEQLTWFQGMQIYASLLLQEDKEVWSPYDDGLQYTPVSEVEGHPSKQTHQQLAKIMGEKILDFLGE